jgi:preprotein translocase subunit YajC
VITAGGIHGKIVTVQDDVITLEVDKGVKMKFNRSSISATAQQAE